MGVGRSPASPFDRNSCPPHGRGSTCDRTSGVVSLTSAARGRSGTAGALLLGDRHVADRGGELDLGEQAVGAVLLARPPPLEAARPAFGAGQRQAEAAGAGGRASGGSRPRIAAFHRRQPDADHLAARRPRADADPGRVALASERSICSGPRMAGAGQEPRRTSARRGGRRRAVDVAEAEPLHVRETSCFEVRVACQRSAPSLTAKTVASARARLGVVQARADLEAEALAAAREKAPSPREPQFGDQAAERGRRSCSQGRAGSARSAKARPTAAAASASAGASRKRASRRQQGRPSAGAVKGLQCPGQQDKPGERDKEEEVVGRSAWAGDSGFDERRGRPRADYIRGTTSQKTNRIPVAAHGRAGAAGLREGSHDRGNGMRKKLAVTMLLAGLVGWGNPAVQAGKFMSQPSAPSDGAAERGDLRHRSAGPGRPVRRSPSRRWPRPSSGSRPARTTPARRS